MAKQSYADRIRQKQRDKATKDLKGSGNGKDWIPAVGTHKVRVLPPRKFKQDTFNSKGELVGKKGEEDDFFYMTHSYHFFEGIGSDGKGKLLWTPRYFEVDGKKIKDPVDEVVSQMYELARENNDASLKNLAGKIKRKRQFFMSVLRYTEDGAELKVIKDASNEGKLISQFCKNMGFPFYRDIQDEWVVEASLEIDEDRELYDLVDIEEGHDFKIKKVKTGSENWDISYDTSLPIRKTRALTEEEIALAKERVDLRNYVTYSTYEEITEALEEFLSLHDMGADDGDEDEAKATSKTKTKKTSKKVINEDEDDDDDDEDDVDVVEEKKVKKTSKKRSIDDDEDEDEKEVKTSSDDEDDEDIDDDFLDDLDDDDEDE